MTTPKLRVGVLYDYCAWLTMNSSYCKPKN